MTTRKHEGGPRMGNAWDAGIGLPPTRHPRIDTKSVPCPTCNAQIGEGCTNQGMRTSPADFGKPCGIHPTRKRMAIRAYNARRHKNG